MSHSVIPKITFFAVVWMVLSAQKAPCPAPLVANLTCYPDMCDYSGNWEQSCLSYELDTVAVIYYSLTHNVSLDDDLSISIDCFNTLSLEEGMLNFTNMVQLNCQLCDFPNFPIVNILSDKSDLKLRSFSFQYASTSTSTLQYIFFQGIEDRLVELSLNGNNFESLQEDIFQKMTNLNLLSLENNNLSTLPDSIFVNQRNLTILNLQRNRFKTIQESIFSPLFNLKELYLSNNMLQSLPMSVFRGLKSLNVLNLSGNNLQMHPLVFTALSELKNLSLARNQLANLPSDIFQMVTNLEHLDISENPFTESLPGDLLDPLPSLKLVKLEGSNLSSIPSNFFSNCPMLSTVILRNNTFQELPEDIFRNNSKLTYINLNRNMISLLSEQIFSNNPQLVDVDLSVNNLTNLPAGLFKKTRQIKRLLLNSNVLRNLDQYVFKRINGLQLLNLSSNRLNVFDVELDPKIEQLDLSHNNIAKLSETFWLTYKNFVYFSIMHNRLGSLETPKDMETPPYKNPSLYFGYNQITYVSTGTIIMKEKTIDPVRVMYDIYLHPNPFSCNCNMQEFKQYLTKNPPTTSVNFADKKKYTCMYPDFLEGKKIVSVPNDDFYCRDDTAGCPALCRCGRRIDALTMVNCSSLGLIQLPREFPASMDVFNFSYNNLSSLDDLSQPKIQSVTKLYFDNNLISSVNLKTIPENATILTLHGNRLSYLSREFLNVLDSVPGLTLTLGENPWECNCSILSLKLWLTENTDRVKDFSNVICQNPILRNGTLVDNQLVATIPQDVICPLNTWPYRLQIIVVSTVAAIIAMFILIASVLYYRNRQTVVAYVYIHLNHIFNFCYQEQDLDEDKIFDAFVCYSGNDRDVAMSLIAELEKKEPSFRLCIHERDWLPGNYITTNIVSSVEKSRRTILVISKEFMDSVWFPVEFQTAYYQMLKDRIDRMIVIIKGDLPNTDTMDKDLQFILTTKTYLVWGERWFSEKLRYAMPHRKTVPPIQLNVTSA